VAYTSSIFNDGNKDDFICVMCLRIVDDPYNTTKCDCTAVYCKSCIMQWLSKKSTCPNCRATTSIRDCCANKWLQKKINQADVHCIHKEEGCTFTGTYGRLENHLAEECDYEKEQCNWEGCNEMIQRRQKDEHESVCEYRPVNCDVCKDEMTVDELNVHQSNVYGCIHLEECENRFTIQQWIDGNKYRVAVQDKLRTSHQLIHGTMMHKKSITNIAPIC
jgi:hypothetical protein